MEVYLQNLGKRKNGKNRLVMSYFVVVFVCSFVVVFLCVTEGECVHVCLFVCL